MRRISALILVLLLIPVLCGCSQEIENYAIVAGAALDVSEQGLRLTVEVADVSSGNADSSGQSLLFSADGADVAEAQKALERRMGKPLYWDHASIILLSRPLCQRGLESAVVWIMSSQAVRISVPLAVCEGSAEQVLATHLDPYKTTAFGLRSMLGNNAERGIGLALPVYRFYNRMQAHGHCTLLPMLALEEDEPTQIGSAVIKDYRFVTTLSPEQTQIYSLLTEPVRSALLSVSRITVRTERTAASLTLKEGKCRFSVRLAGVLDQGVLPKGEDPKQLLSRELIGQAQALVAVSKQLNCDFLRLNDAAYKAHPKDFTERAVADFSVEIVTDIHIYDYGQAQAWEN